MTPPAAAPLAALRPEAEALWRWLTEAALPLWRTRGWGGPRRGFLDGLDEAGQPLPTPEIRLLTQARQIGVFAQAALLGWPHGMDQAAAALDLLRREAWLPEGGWARALRPRDGQEGGIADLTLDLYDNAFMLLALARMAQAGGEAAPVALAHRTLDAIEARLRLPGTPGFANAAPPPPGPREQNPHMHLLEAALALHEASPEPRFAALGREMVALFAERFFEPSTGTLAEFFGSDWQRLPEAWPGRRLWPGHHYEWCWLLHQAAARFGTEWRAPARALAGFARLGPKEATIHALGVATAGDHGPAEDGAVPFTVTAEGVVVDSARHIWVQTEALRGLLLLAVEGEADPAAAAALFRQLRRHLAHQPPGRWSEVLDPAGAPLDARSLAINLHHLMVAATAALRLTAA